MRKGLELVCLVALGGALSCAGLREADPPPQPNILVMVVDDMRWDDFGAAGHAFVETPNIDRLANEGARFTNAFTVVALCSPARGALLTGLYPHTNGIIDNTERGPRSHELVTFPRQLHESGYNTAFVGKWHMGNDDSPRPGFDYWVSMRGQGRVLNPTITENGVREQVDGHVTEIFTERAISFLEQERDQPFALYVAYKALHPGRGGLAAGGFHAPEKYEDRYVDAVVARRPNYGVIPTDKPALQRPLDQVPEISAETVTPDQTIRDRMEMLLGIDESLGRFLEILEAQGELDNTVVVFTSDHGYFYGEHGLNAERRFAFEETIRVPLLVRYPPAVPAGITPDQLVTVLDLAPTVLAYAGVESSIPLQGFDLGSVMQGDAPGWRTSFLFEHQTDPDSYLGNGALARARNMGYRAVRTENHKYVRYSDLEGMDELYDLTQDPYEMANLFSVPDAQALLADMRAELERHLVETEDPGPGGQ